MTNGTPKKLFGLGKANAAFFAAQQTGCFVLLVPDFPTLQQVVDELAWLAPEKQVYPFPGWDVQPYDRLAPQTQIQAQRIAAAQAVAAGQNCIVVASVGGVSIKLPLLESLHKALMFKVGEEIDFGGLRQQLTHRGYKPVSTVMEPGEFSVRGGILDVFPTTESMPCRIEFFDDEIEHIKTFSPTSQRTEDNIKTLSVAPASELVMTPQGVENFRTAYRTQFAGGQNDDLYAHVSNKMLDGMAWHYLPLFFKKPLPSLFQLLPAHGKIIALPGVEEAMNSRQESIADAFEMRQKLLTEKTGMEDPYRPIPPQALYLSREEFAQTPIQYSAHFDDGDKNIKRLPYASHIFTAPTGTPERVKEAIKQAKQNAADATIIFSALTPASLARMGKMLEDEKTSFTIIKKFSDAKNGISLALSPVRWGMLEQEKKSGSIKYCIITEQDLFGQKQHKTTVKKRKAEDILNHFSELEKGDLVIHQDHGIGRFIKLITLSPSGEAQDFLELEYSGNDKLFIPVTSLDVISRYGVDSEEKKLDKLGSASWQARKAKVKENLMAMAGELIEVAAQRALRKGNVFQPPQEIYNAFCATFPYTPTAEQQAAFDDVEKDLASPKAMERLIVGDVGFGKTEVALRAAFIVAASGKQVVLLAPTTLLARQHYELFKKRLSPFGLNVALLSRFVTGKTKKEALKNLKNGLLDVVVGTHALLSDQVQLNDLGLIIVDEEQRFGVAHKEKLKKLKENVEVLTISATPIPRTLQMGMSGMTSLSMITTPPVDRQAIRSYVSKFDAKVVREAILREIYRGGQVYVVTPRIQDLEKLTETLVGLVPEAKIRSAHGQMPKEVLERLMEDFYDGQFNVLVSTTIVESGLDIPSANTLIINRADRFGLAQLYQLRGRVGRSSVQAYAYFLMPAQGNIAEGALKRLQILQRLNTLGAGFTLASYDLDIRGSGNLLGKQQSGHIKEVGFALYNQLLAEAIAERRRSKGEDVVYTEKFTPALSFGFSYMISAEYVEDEAVRMALYRRLAAVEDAEEMANFADELIDRFGPMPPAAQRLIDVMLLQIKCKNLGIESIEAGNRGFSLKFRENNFAAADKLLAWIAAQKGTVSIKPDHKLVVHKAWQTSAQQLKGVELVLNELEELTKTV